MKRVTCLLRDEIHLKLKIFAASNDKTVIQCIAEAVEMYLHQSNKKST